MLELKKDALQKIELAIAKRLNAIITAYNQGDVVEVIRFVQCSVISYDDIVEPSKLSLEDEFWSCVSVTEKEQHTQEIKLILEFMQAGKMAAAMDEVAALKGSYISDTTARQIYSLIEDYMSNKEEYDAYDA